MPRLKQLTPKSEHLGLIIVLVALAASPTYWLLRPHLVSVTLDARNAPAPLTEVKSSAGVAMDAGLPSASRVRPAPALIRISVDAFYSRDIAATNANLALALAIKQMAAADPNGLVAWVKSLLQSGESFEGFDIPRIAGTAVEALLQKGDIALARSAVEQWAQVGPPLGNNTFEAVALDIAGTSPTGAMAWLKSLPASNDRNYALTTLSAVWVKSDPKAAMEWAMQLGSADGREPVMERAFNQWAQDDEASARQWLNGHLSDPVAEKMVVSMVAESDLAYSNPQEAIVWADMISDPSARLENVEDVFLSWARRDLDAAANYIKDDPALTPAEKKQVLESFYSWKNGGAAN